MLCSHLIFSSPKVAKKPGGLSKSTEVLQEIRKKILWTGSTKVEYKYVKIVLKSTWINVLSYIPPLKYKQTRTLWWWHLYLMYKFYEMHVINTTHSTGQGSELCFTQAPLSLYCSTSYLTLSLFHSWFPLYSTTLIDTGLMTSSVKQRLGGFSWSILLFQ